MSKVLAVDVVRIAKRPMDSKDKELKQDESNGDLKFTITIGLGGNLACY
jgi:hypothetical protein